MTKQTNRSEETFGELNGQIALVTGATSGIGRAVASELSAAGAAVIVHGRDQRKVDTVVKQIQDTGSTAHAAVCDLASDAESLRRFAQQAWDWQGRVDVWVNNAGCDVLTGGAADLDFESKLQRLWEVDVRGTILLSRLVGQRMRSELENGVICNLGWDQAEWGMAGDSGEMFSAIKAAVMAFSRSLAKSLAPQVRVHCVAPGWIKTAWGANASDEWQTRARREALVDRWGNPMDVAKAIRFLVSEDSAFINGGVLRVNGGFCAGPRGSDGSS